MFGDANSSSLGAFSPRSLPLLLHLVREEPIPARELRAAARLLPLGARSGHRAPGCSRRLEAQLFRRLGVRRNRVRPQRRPQLVAPRPSDLIGEAELALERLRVDAALDDQIHGLEPRPERLSRRVKKRPRGERRLLAALPALDHVAPTHSPAASRRRRDTGSHSASEPGRTSGGRPPRFRSSPGTPRPSRRPVPGAGARETACSTRRGSWSAPFGAPGSVQHSCRRVGISRRVRRTAGRPRARLGFKPRTSSTPARAERRTERKPPARGTRKWKASRDGAFCEEASRPV